MSKASRSSMVWRSQPLLLSFRVIFGDIVGRTDLKDGIAKAASEEAVVSDGRRDAARGITVQEHNAGQQVDAVQVTLIFCMKTWCCTNLLPLQCFWHMLQGG